MSACPACGYGGSPESQSLKDFILLICGQCGVGVGMKRREAPNQPDTPETPATGAYELSPTGQHSVVTHNMVNTGSETSPEPEPPDVPDAATQSVGSGTVYIVSASAGVVSSVEESGVGSKAFATTMGFQSGLELLEAFVSEQRAGDNPTLIAIHGDVEDFPAAELVFAIRSIETGLDSEKTPLLIVCADEDEWSERSRGLGNARAVRLPNGLSDEEIGARLVALVERASSRS